MNSKTRKCLLAVSMLGLGTANAQKAGPSASIGSSEACQKVLADNQATQGQKNWIYGNYELASTFEITDGILAGMKRLGESLDVKGIKLIVALIPTRGSTTKQFASNINDPLADSK